MGSKEKAIQFGKIDINNDELIMINDIFSDFKEDCKRADNMLSDLNKKISDDYKKIKDEEAKRYNDEILKACEDAQYSKDEVLQLRKNKDNRLYNSLNAVNDIIASGYIWENGKVGYFIPIEPIGRGADSIIAYTPFGRKRTDGNGLRFVQVHKDNKNII